MIVRVEGANGDHHREEHRPVHLANGETIKSHKSDQNKLNNGQCGHHGHLEALEKRISLRGGLRGGGYHRFLLVSGHFYYLLRK